MTAINNLNGHIVRDGKVLYEEKLKDNLFFVIVEMYEQVYLKNNHVSSSQWFVDTAITNGRKVTWSNGVISYEAVEHKEEKLETESFNELEQLKTKDGYTAKQVVYSEQKYSVNNKKLKSRIVKWIIEIPKNELRDFILKPTNAKEI